MEIKPTYVTFEQAKLLKEKGFDVECNSYYNFHEPKQNGLRGLVTPKEHKTGIYQDHNGEIEDDDLICSAPEQWQVVEWLWVNRGIWVWVRPYKDHAADNNDPIQHQMNVYKNGVTVSKEFNSHEEAYSAAFDYILNNLI
jgi:hypothetical protein